MMKGKMMIKKAKEKMTRKEMKKHTFQSNVPDLVRVNISDKSPKMSIPRIALNYRSSLLGRLQVEY